MSQKLSIRIKIADRDYPLEISSQQEAHIRQVGKQINAQLRSYREEFGVEDKQDLLSMFAIDCMMQKEETLQQKNSIESVIVHKIDYLNHLLDQHL